VIESEAAFPEALYPQGRIGVEQDVFDTLVRKQGEHGLAQLAPELHFETAVQLVPTGSRN
jgi:hypothetical protein